MKTFDEISIEVNAWREKNFPKQPPYHGFLGLVEEIGELCRAILKQEQTQLYGSEDRYITKDWVAEEKDSFADAIIFLFGYCALNDIQFKYNVYTIECQGLIEYILDVNRAIIMLCEYEDVARVVDTLKAFAVYRGIDLLAEVNRTWQMVSKRTRK